MAQVELVPRQAGRYGRRVPLLTCSSTGAAVALVVDAARCTGCGACIPTCPVKAVRRAPGAPVIDAERCTSCFDCVEVCPAGAIGEAPHSLKAVVSMVVGARQSSAYPVAEAEAKAGTEAPA